MQPIWRFFIIQGCLLGFAHGIIAQNQAVSKQSTIDLIQDKQEYMETFNKEQHQLGRQQGEQPSFVDTRPAYVPRYFLNLNKGASANNFVLGISDPCLDTLVALKMAKYRALAIGGLLKQCSIQYISDYYQNETTNVANPSSKNTWEEYGAISSTVAYEPQDLKSVQTHFTRYEEGMARLNIAAIDPSPSEERHTLNTKVDVYHIRKQVGNHHKDQWKYDLKISLKNDTTKKVIHRYTLVHTSEGRKITSTWKGRQDSLCSAYFLYRIKPPPKDTASMKTTHSLNNGLWAAYFRSIINHLLHSTHQKAKKIKNVQQDYNENYEDLSRLVARDYYQLQLNNLTIIDNRLQTDVEVNHTKGD